MVKYIIGIGLFLAFFIACFNSESTKLPYLGEHEVNGQDTIYHKIGDFSFQDQDSNLVTNGLLKDKIYVANFFFTSCPTICPKTMKQMKRVYDKYLKDTSIVLVSFSIDHYHDSIPTLKRYANKLEISGQRWHLLSGKKGETQKIAGFSLFGIRK
ncbi:MAG: SCO family protein [Saprospiraceae bacterium]|nr:SCO family protein [Saprospiraceae bacterium]